MYSSKYWPCFHPYSFPITEGHVTSPTSSVLSVNKMSNSIANSPHQSTSSSLSVKSNCVESADGAKYSFEPICSLKNSPPIFSSTFTSINSLNVTGKICQQTDSLFHHQQQHHHQHHQLQQNLPYPHHQKQLQLDEHQQAPRSNVIASSRQSLAHLQKSLNCKPISNSLHLQQSLSMANIHSGRKVNANRGADSLFMNSFDLPSSRCSSLSMSTTSPTSTSSMSAVTTTAASNSSSHHVIASQLHTSTEPIKAFDSSSSSSSSSCYWVQGNSYVPRVYDLLGNRLNNLTPETTQLIHSSTHCNSNKDTLSGERAVKSITNKSSRSQSKLSQSSEILSLDLQVKKKPRCPRTCFTYEQLDMLERYFNESSQYPDSNIKFTLAQLTNLSQARISVWFKNRRAKHRKAIKLSSTSFANRILPTHHWFFSSQTSM